VPFKEDRKMTPSLSAIDFVLMDLNLEDLLYPFSAVNSLWYTYIRGG
jgi:hypothetical protein